MTKQKNKKPIRIKAGRGVVAKLWKNRNKKGEWYNVTITRVYTDDEGEFHDSDSFSRDNLLQVAYAAEQSFEYIRYENDDTEYMHE